jgi:hypothetical protein
LPRAAVQCPLLGHLLLRDQQRLVFFRRQLGKLWVVRVGMRISWTAVLLTGADPYRAITNSLPGLGVRCSGR